MDVTEFFISIIIIVIIVFGVLQIILFFKIWAMTNNVRELKKMYDDRSKKLISSICSIVDEIKKSSTNKVDSKLEEKISSEEIKKDKNSDNQDKEETKKVIKVTDENENDFKRCLHKWEILKKKGFAEQAIKEYMQYTGLEREFAEEFINGL